MLFNFNYQSALLLFFFLQGLIFALLLFFKGREYRNKTSQWLSLFVILCCFYITPWMLGHAGWYANDGYRETLFFIPFQQLFLIGPVIYFYTRSLINSSFQMSRLDWWHFLPAALYLGYSLVIFVVDQFFLEEYYFYANGRDKDLDPWYQITGLASMIIYTVLSIRHYNQYRKAIFDELSYADTVTFNWMRQFLLALLIILSLRITFLILYPNWGSFGMKWWYYILFASLAYFIALQGYNHALTFIFPTNTPLKNSPLALFPEPALQEASTANTQDEAISETVELAAHWQPQLEALMQDQQLFLNSTLTLTDLAQALGTTSKQVSMMINQGFGVNFNDFVNNYRIEAVKERFARQEHQTHTILSIALACGFNSKTTFNRVFKRNAGITPVQYLKELAVEANWPQK